MLSLLLLKNEGIYCILSCEWDIVLTGISYQLLSNPEPDQMSTTGFSAFTPV